MLGFQSYFGRTSVLDSTIDLHMQIHWPNKKECFHHNLAYGGIKLLSFTSLPTTVWSWTIPHKRTPQPINEASHPPLTMKRFFCHQESQAHYKLQQVQYRESSRQT